MTATTTGTTLAVVDCPGSPRHRGRVHGETLRGTIALGLDRWFAAIERRHKVDPDEYVADFIASTSFLPAIRQWTPDLLDEVIGIAEGAAKPFAHIFALNLLDEEWEYAQNRQRPAPGCTAVCWRGDEQRAPVIAQTMDLPDVHDGTQCVLRITPDDRPMVQVLSFAGALGVCGGNAAGVGVVVNNLSTLPAGSSGLPVVFVLRGILEQTSLDDAASFVLAVPHATGQHYAIGDPTGVSGFEGWNGGATELADHGSHHLHTNHPLGDGPERANAEQDYIASRTRERLALVTSGAAGATTQLGIETLLQDQTAPVSIAPRRGFMTFGGVSMELTAPPTFHIAAGPPHLHPWVDVPFPETSA